VRLLSRTDPDLIAAARGDRPADVLLENVRVVNVFTRSIEDGPVAIAGGRFISVGKEHDALERIDLGGSYLAPGLIDAHMHVESTQMLPSAFAAIALAHGTTGAVLDPHEIANVCGLAGIQILLDDAADLPMRLFFAASSCVPASPLETSGTTLTADDLAPLLDDPRVIALAEMMNYPGVVHGDSDVLAKVTLGLEHGIVDGHCPGLTGSSLDAYVAAGISSDHECTTAKEAMEKLARGMMIAIREGSAARKLDALLPIVTDANAQRCCFCTDDRHPSGLVDEGHIDHVVRRAVSLGLDPCLALAMGSLHPALHYRLDDLGAIAPGRLADCFSFSSLDDITPDVVFIAGEVVAKDGHTVDGLLRHHQTPSLEIARETVHISDGLTSSELVPAAPDGRHEIRVIDVIEHQLVTNESREVVDVTNTTIESDPARDLAHVAVLERHHGTGNVGKGIVRGFGLKRGAIASTVGHDAHNLTIVGVDPEDMLLCAKALAAVGGGQCVACDGRITAMLELPIAGLISTESASHLALRQQELDAAAGELGCTLHDPFMQLSFLPLSVIPTLKISDQGLVDVDRFEIVPLICSD